MKKKTPIKNNAKKPGINNKPNYINHNMNNVNNIRTKGPTLIQGELIQDAASGGKIKETESSITKMKKEFEEYKKIMDEKINIAIKNELEKFQNENGALVVKLLALHGLHKVLTTLASSLVFFVGHFLSVDGHDLVASALHDGAGACNQVSDNECYHCQTHDNQEENGMVSDAL